VNGLGRLVDLVAGFLEGFRGRSWDAAAEESIERDLALFRQLRSVSDADKQRLQPRIHAVQQTRLPLLRSRRAVEALINRAAVLLVVAAMVVPPWSSR
jgi:type VI protein secretion system component VasF